MLALTFVQGREVTLARATVLQSRPEDMNTGVRPAHPATRRAGAGGEHVHVGKGGPIVRLSPMDAPALVVRHYEYRLRVDGNVRELGDTQFRFVPGLFGSGTVALQSVNYPDRYVRVDGDAIRIDPFEDTDAFGRAAGFARVPGLADGGAVSLRVGTDTYLAHETGQLVVSRPGNDRDSRRRATFRLE